MTDTVNVPCEPTREMLEAFFGCAEVSWSGSIRNVEDAYRAMLAAAPKAEPVSDLPAISFDGPHLPNDHRVWLARQLLDSKNDDETAYGIAAFSPAVSELWKKSKTFKDLRTHPEAPKVEQEPVAWLVTNKASGAKDLSFTKLADFPFNRSRFDAEPLYTHHDPFSGELYEALVDLASWFDKPVQGLLGPVWAIPSGEQGADDAVEAAQNLIAKHKGPQS